MTWTARCSIRPDSAELLISPSSIRPCSMGNRRKVSHADMTGPTFLEALKEQLGLKLVPQTAPVDVLVLDHVEEPSPN